MTAYYNEFDPKAASWLRELIKQGHIAPGDVDERSIVDVRPDDLVGYDQCHFFAGIGGWSYALRQAGWEDSRKVWTGSCPCQPFSAAGKRGGVDDARHLWPEFFRLIAECNPSVVFGEQVASKDGLAWLDAVYADLEGADYAVGAVDCCAAGVGAPHIRQRLYFVAESNGTEREAWRVQPFGTETRSERIAQSGAVDFVADSECTEGARLGQHGGEILRVEETIRSGSGGSPCNGFWSNADWLPCRDGKSRPVESCLEPVADGLSCELGLVRLESGRVIYSPLIQKGKARVMRLRGYGNAISPPLATEFILSYMEVTA